MVSGVRNSKASCTAVKGDLGAVWKQGRHSQWPRQQGARLQSGKSGSHSDPETAARLSHTLMLTRRVSPQQQGRSEARPGNPGRGSGSGFLTEPSKYKTGRRRSAAGGGPAVEPQPKSSSQGKGGAAPAWSFLHNSSYQQRSWPWMQPATLLNLPNYTPRRRLCSGPWQIQCNAALVKPMKQPWSTTFM